MTKIFEKDGKFSKPSVILVVTWAIVLIWYALSGFPFMKGWDLDEALALGLLSPVFAYYFGRYNLTVLRKEFSKEWRKYTGRVKKK